MKRFLGILIFAGVALGQGTSQYNGTVPSALTVTQLAALTPSAYTGVEFLVKDSTINSGGTCTTSGSGSTPIKCWSNGSSWQPEGGTGGSGASSTTQLTDCTIVRTSATVVTGTCPSAGTNFGTSSYVSPLAGTFTLTFSAGAAASATTIYFYVSGGAVLVDSSGSSGSLAYLTCGGTLGCTVTNSGATAYPARVKSIARVTAGNTTANQVDAFSSCPTGISFTTGCADDRAFLSISPVTVSTGLTQSIVNGLTTLSVDSTQVPFVYTGALSGIPATCTVGQIAFITNATAGQNQYNCTATNTWTQNTGGSGSYAATWHMLPPARASTGSGAFFNWGTEATGTSSANCSQDSVTGPPCSVYFASSGTPVMNTTVALPTGWTTGAGISLWIDYSINAPGNIEYTVGLICPTTDVFTAISYVTTSSGSIAVTGDSNRHQNTLALTLTSTGCAAGDTAYLQFSRNNSVGSNASGNLNIMNTALIY